MPAKKYTKRRRKAVVKRKRKPSPYVPIGGFLNRMAVRLRYVENITLDAGVGTYAEHIFRANSLADPSYTGAGHQPSNFDRLSAIYDRYTVLGAKCKVYWVPTSSTALTYPPTLVVHLSESGTDVASAFGYGGVQNVLEQPRISRNVHYVGFGQGNATVLSRSFSASKFFGRKNIIGLEPYTADVANSPSEQAYFEVAAISPDGSSNPTPLVLRVEIEYFAIMTEPKLSDAS